LLEAELSDLCGDKWEVLFIDDGSTDSSYNVIESIHERNSNFKGIKLRRNYGKSGALNVGMSAAQGDFIVTMDADLQDDPREVRNLLAKMGEGYDLVSGWKKVRHDPVLAKNIPSKIFNWATSKVSGVKLHDFNCGLKMYSKECAKSLDIYGEMHRFLPALAHMDGYKVTEIPVLHHARKYGSTKFGLSRFINGYLDLLTVLFTAKYLRRPLHFFGLIGTFLATVGVVTELVLIIQRAMGATYLSNRPLFILGGGLIIVGIQFVSMGLIGEWILKNNISNNTNKINVEKTTGYEDE
jgi:glycosyltransferase involved in cell wall biosynthesis